VLLHIVKYKILLTLLSSGRISGGELVNNGNGTLNILLGSGMIKTSDNIIGETVFFNWPTTNNITPVNNETSCMLIIMVVFQVFYNN
jgi:hypothetical protein